MPLLIALLLVLLLAFGYLFYAYNRLTQLRNALETEWSDIDVILKKRHDLIPNIIEVVKGYAKHERSVLEDTAKARAAFATRGKERNSQENELSSFVSSIFALRESYPDLKANPSFMDLQKELFKLEDEIAERRFNYNDVVKAYNDFILKFPGNVVSGLIGFAYIEPFEFVGSREVPVVDLGESQPVDAALS